MLQPIVQERAASSSSADVEVFSVEVVSKGTDLSKISKIADSLNSLGGTRSEDSPAASIWFTAARKGDTVTLQQRLYDKGARVNRRGKRGRTALFYAAEGGHLDTLHFLVAHGADHKLVDDTQVQSPLQVAEEKGHVLCAQFLRTLDEASAATPRGLPTDESNTPHLGTSPRTTPRSMQNPAHAFAVHFTRHTPVRPSFGWAHPVVVGDKCDALGSEQDGVYTPMPGDLAETISEEVEVTPLSEIPPGEAEERIALWLRAYCFVHMEASRTCEHLAASPLVPCLQRACNAAARSMPLPLPLPLRLRRLTWRARFPRRWQTHAPCASPASCRSRSSALPTPTTASIGSHSLIMRTSLASVTNCRAGRTRWRRTRARRRARRQPTTARS